MCVLCVERFEKNSFLNKILEFHIFYIKNKSYSVYSINEAGTAAETVATLKK